MNETLHIDLDTDAIMDALEAAVKTYPMKALAPKIGKRYTTLANEFSEQPGYKLGFIDALRILAVTRDLRPLDMIEAAFDRVAFQLPRADSSNMSNVMHLIARVTKEFGEHMEEGSRALADGMITEKEAKKWLKELKDVMEAGVELQAYLEQFVKIKSL